MSTITQLFGCLLQGHYILGRCWVWSHFTLQSCNLLTWHLACCLKFVRDSTIKLCQILRMAYNVAWHTCKFSFFLLSGDRIPSLFCQLLLVKFQKSCWLWFKGQGWVIGLGWPSRGQGLPAEEWHLLLVGCGTSWKGRKFFLWRDRLMHLFHTCDKLICIWIICMLRISFFLIVGWILIICFVTIKGKVK